MHGHHFPYTAYPVVWRLSSLFSPLSSLFSLLPLSSPLSSLRDDKQEEEERGSLRWGNPAPGGYSLTAAILAQSTPQGRNGGGEEDGGAEGGGRTCGDGGGDGGGGAVPS